VPRQNGARQRKNALEGRVLAAYRTRARRFVQKGRPPRAGGTPFAETYSTTSPFCEDLLDVPLSAHAGVGGIRFPAWDQDKPLELGYEYPILVVDARVDLDGAAIGL
jgi:hypothetical protein